MATSSASASAANLKARTRQDYQYLLDYRLRWNDNDMFDHLNNSVYNFLFDSIINSYLITHCNQDPPTSPQYGLVVHSHTDYYAPIAYPAVADLALRVNKLGRSSVTYEVAVFERGVDAVCAVGEFVHVFVDRATGRPAQSGLGEALRLGLEKLRVGDAGEAGKTRSTKL
ncbi:hypothetical protein QQZ08_010697 [Neonectria magnoliae]|uniref:Thioesterase domain-containing protein n=1 Tax=Neonectria magnoliae TaxID=2732573 RepID=A0ABR1HG43_9HYPO